MLKRLRNRVQFLGRWGETFLSPMSKLALLPSQSSTERVPGTFPAVKQLGYKAEYSPPPSAKVKNAWTYTSVSPHSFMARCLIKDGVKFFSNLHANPTPSKSNKIKL